MMKRSQSTSKDAPIMNNHTRLKRSFATIGIATLGGVTTPALASVHNVPIAFAGSEEWEQIDSAHQPFILGATHSVSFRSTPNANLDRETLDVAIFDAQSLESVQEVLKTDKDRAEARNADIRFIKDGGQDIVEIIEKAQESVIGTRYVFNASGDGYVAQHVIPTERMQHPVINFEPLTSMQVMQEKP